MKKIFLVTIVMAIAVVLRAQVSGGLKAGLNIATLRGQDKNQYDVKSLVGYHVGGFVNIPLSAKFEIQPELLYSTVSGDGEYSNVKASIDYDYITLPVVVHYRFKSGFFAELGPQLDFMLATKATALGTTQDVKDQFKSTNVSAIIGGGYKHVSGFGGTVRYAFGFTKITQDPSDLRTDVFSIGLFYAFEKKKSKR